MRTQQHEGLCLAWLLLTPFQTLAPAQHGAHGHSQVRSNCMGMRIGGTNVCGHRHPRGHGLATALTAAITLVGP